MVLNQNDFVKKKILKQKQDEGATEGKDNFQNISSLTEG